MATFETVRFVGSRPPYYPGDVATFPAAHAAELVQRRLAVKEKAAADPPRRPTGAKEPRFEDIDALADSQGVGPQ